MSGGRRESYCSGDGLNTAQKTINSSGGGEFPQQVFDFMGKNQQLYEDYFVGCGWVVEGERSSAKMYYLKDGEKITGDDLKQVIRSGCSESTYGRKVESKAMAAILWAIITDEFYEQQLLDFSKRMRLLVLETPIPGYSFRVKDLFKSSLGKATALDHHINRSGNMAKDIASALDRFFSSNPGVSKDVSVWGEQHYRYEKEVLDDYGDARRMAKVNGVSVAPARYSHLKAQL